MSFGLVPASPFVNQTTIVDAAYLNFLRASIANALDAVGGGSYALLAGHTWTMSSGGGNIVFNADFTASAIVAATFTAASVVSSLSQAWTFGRDSNTTIEGGVGHPAIWSWGVHSQITDSGTWFRDGSETWVTGGTVLYQASSVTFGADSTTSVQGSSGHNALWSYGGFSTVTDASTWTRTGTESWTAGGITVHAGVIITGSAASVWNINGAFATPTHFDFNGDGSLTSCDLRLQTAARLMIDSSSRIVSSGPIFRLGSVAVDVLRDESLAPSVSGSWDPSTSDTWIVPTGMAADVALSLVTPTIGPFEFTVYSRNPSAQAHNLDILKGANDLFTFDKGFTSPLSVTFRWTGVRYIVRAFVGNNSANSPNLTADIWG